MDYARMIMPNGKRIAGIGTYHMELDTEGGELSLPPSGAQCW